MVEAIPIHRMKVMIQSGFWDPGKVYLDGKLLGKMRRSEDYPPIHNGEYTLYQHEYEFNYLYADQTIGF